MKINMIALCTFVASRRTWLTPTETYTTVLAIYSNKTFPTLSWFLPACVYFNLKGRILYTITSRYKWRNLTKLLTPLFPSSAWCRRASSACCGSTSGWTAPSSASSTPGSTTRCEDDVWKYKGWFDSLKFSTGGVRPPDSRVHGAGGQDGGRDGAAGRVEGPERDRQPSDAEEGGDREAAVWLTNVWRKRMHLLINLMKYELVIRGFSFRFSRRTSVQFLFAIVVRLT